LIEIIAVEIPGLVIEACPLWVTLSCKAHLEILVGAGGKGVRQRPSLRRSEAPRLAGVRRRRRLALAAAADAVRGGAARPRVAAAPLQCLEGDPRGFGLLRGVAEQDSRIYGLVGARAGPFARVCGGEAVGVAAFGMHQRPRCQGWAHGWDPPLL
jgi:hypothetical protein